MKTIAVVICAFIALSAPAQDSWEKRVGEAKSPEAMLALVREALSVEVRPSGTTHSEAVHADDNEPAPVVDFDARLNEKVSSNGRVLATSPAYYFLAEGVPYVVLGPRSLDARSPVFTRLQAEHELFHAKHHVGDPRPIGDRELETWTHVFVTLFEDVHPFKQRWAPLVSFYEDADSGEQKASVDKLAEYYRSSKPAVRTAFDEWLARRRKDEKTASSKLVADLGKAITG